MRQRDSGREAGGGGAEPGGRLASLLSAGEPVESLLRKAQFFTPGTPSEDYRELHRRGGRGAEEFYRERWRHDKEVRSTHGGELHRVVLVEGVRQGRDHHLGDAADRLSVGGPGLARASQTNQFLMRLLRDRPSG